MTFEVSFDLSFQQQASRSRFPAQKDRQERHVVDAINQRRFRDEEAVSTDGIEPSNVAYYLMVAGLD